MSEDSLRAYVVAGLMKHCRPCAVTKHNDAVTPGIPDLSYRVRGVNGWCELKEVPRLPARAATVVRFGCELTTAQALFLLDRDGKLLVRVTPLKLYLGLDAAAAWAMQRAGGWSLERMREHAAEWRFKIDWEEFAEWLSTRTI